MNLIGKVLKDRYQILLQLGKGGMSTVYLAKDLTLDSYWAIKRIDKRSSIDLEVFKKEVELLASLNHPDVPRIVDRIENSRYYFVCMDFIDGVSLGKKVKVEGAQSEKDVVRWTKLLTDILEYLHEARENPIVYRDMKPDNIMLTQNGRVKLIDFGIAKECIRGKKESGPKVGTRGYAAPEQYKGECLDERTDIYSLGITMFHLVTGVQPTGSTEQVNSMREINPMISEGLEYIIKKCVKEDPKERYQNCRELREDLNKIDTLNRAYNKKVNKRLIAFMLVCMLFALSLVSVFIGNYGMKKNAIDSYYTALSNGIEYERNNNTDLAKEEYKKAIEYKPSELEPYLKLFYLLLPYDNNDYINRTKYAIDTIKQYIDNEYSPIKNNSKLLYVISQKCIEVNDPIYAGYANDYIGIIKESKEYKEGEISKSELKTLGIIALNKSRDTGTQDFQELNNALLELESYTNNADAISLEDKLNNYNTIINIYNTYPDKLENSYEKIFNIGSKTKEIIDMSSQGEELKFNSILTMYETVASNLYNWALCTEDINSKREILNNAKLWFQYLDDLNDDLSQGMILKKGNVYKALFDTYSTPEESGNIDEEVLGYINNAASIYEDGLSKYPSNFSMAMSLTQSYIDIEFAKPNSTKRNFTKIKEAYRKVLNIKSESKEISNSALSQFSALKKRMELLGVDE